MPVMSASEVLHLSRRSGFGRTVAQLQSFIGQERSTVVNAFLDAPREPLSFPTLDPGTSDYTRLTVIRRWWLQRMIDVANPLEEKLTLFWHNLIPTSYWKVPLPELLLAQNATTRDLAFGSIPLLVKALAVDPAMLLYLDNAENVAGAPNENFARELMELFTLGVDNGYSQLDVVESARAWSGYTLNAAKQFVFDPAQHDGGIKRIFDIDRAWTGPELVDEILTGSRALQSSRFLAQRFWAFYAAPTTDAVFIDALATQLRSVNLNTREFLRLMFNRDEFYAERSRNTLVRSPIEWGVSLLRSTGIGVVASGLDWALAALGQVPFEPPSVSGWKPNQYWVTEAATWKKASMASHIGWIANAGDFLGWIAAANVDAAVQGGLDAFGIPSVSSTTRAALASVLVANRHPDFGGGGQRSNLVRAIALSPEFQLA
jgi:uncharacterized protein (DUF1800 family)